MAVLLVDERFGRVLGEIQAADAQGVLEAWARDHRTIPDYVCLVERHSRHGAVGADTSAKVRSLQEY